MKARSLGEFGDDLATWVQPDPAGRFNELRSSDVVVANLRWENFKRCLATGETAEGRWTLKRVAFLRPERFSPITLDWISWTGERKPWRQVTGSRAR